MVVYWPWGVEYRVLRSARTVIFTCEDERLLAPVVLVVSREELPLTALQAPPANGAELAQTFCPAIRACRTNTLFVPQSYSGKKGCDLLVSAFAQINCTRR
jgi:hypothetical protein